MSIPRTPTRNLDAFISENQRKSQSKSQAEIDRADDAALQQALRASLMHEDDGPTGAQQLARDGALTQAQLFALEARDPASIQEANDQALALGIAASLEHDNTPKKTPRTHVPDHEIVEQRSLSEKLRDVLRKRGFDIRPNKGNRHNCLIISMLQHVTGDYHSEHTAKARHYKKLLVEQSGGTEKTRNALHSDGPLTEWLIATINRDYFGDAKDQYVKFKLVSTDLNGELAVVTIGEGARVGGIVDLAGHFEAYTKRVAD